MSEYFFITESDPPAKRMIMIQALRLFSRQGLCETSIRDIAAASGYTNPALYKHFSGKDALALELFVACYSQLMRALDAAVSQHDTFSARLRALVATYLARFDTNPDAVIFATEHLAKFWPEVSAAMKSRTIITLIAEVIATGESEGCVQPGLDRQVRSAVVAGSLGQLVRLVYLEGLAAPARQYEDDLVATLGKSLC